MVTKVKEKKRKLKDLSNDEIDEILEFIKTKTLASEIIGIYNISPYTLNKIKENNNVKREYKKKNEIVEPVSRVVEITGPSSVVLTDIRKHINIDKTATDIKVNSDIDIIRKYLPEENLNIIKTESNMFYCGLIANRHDMPVDKFIFKESFSQNLFKDFHSQYVLVHNFFKDNKVKGKKVILYVTGLQCALGSVIKVCYDQKIDLRLMHYDPNTNKYYGQDIYDFGEIKEDHIYTKFANIKGISCASMFPMVNNTNKNNFDIIYVKRAIQIDGDIKIRYKHLYYILPKNNSVDIFFDLAKQIQKDLVESDNKVKYYLELKSASVRENVLEEKTQMSTSILSKEWIINK